MKENERQEHLFYTNNLYDENNKKIIVSYRKRWGTDGTCYRQTIKIDDNTKEKYNHYLMNKKTKIDNNFFKSHCYSGEDLKIKSLEYLENGVNFTNLIHLRLFIEFYLKELYTPPKKDRDFERITYNNTIIEVI